MPKAYKSLTVERWITVAGSPDDQPRYKVIKAVNVLEPNVGDFLTKEDVQRQIDSGTTVMVVQIK